MKTTKKPRFDALLQHRADSSERTRIEFHEALDRFEHGHLIHLPPGSKLTLRNLALEAGGKSKDTPLSKYGKGHPKAGQYRFPDVATRYHALKKKGQRPRPPQDPRDEKIQELRELVKAQDEKILLLARTINEVDAENVELKRRVKEYEELVKKLRRESLKLVTLKKKGKGKK